MENKFCFVAVDFENDPNVRGNKYWYISKDESVKEGDYVVAPLGRHNNEQIGKVKEVRFEPETSSPCPANYIKGIRKVIKKS